MDYNNIMQRIVNGEFDDMEEVFDGNRDILFNRLTLLDNISKNMSTVDRMLNDDLIIGFISDVEAELL